MSDHREPLTVKIFVIKYLKNNFLLLVPVIVWNIAFRHLLPEVFSFDNYWNELPSVVFWGENISRFFIYTFTFFMPLTIFSKKQYIGLAIYLAGMFFYFLSWRPLILFPASDWSLSLHGFIAPAISPIIILFGIGLIGNRLFLSIPYRKLLFYTICIIFIFFSTWHGIIIHGRILVN